MAKVRIELDSDGVRELLQSPEMEKICDEQAERMTRATGMKYSRDIYTGRYRVRAGAYTGDKARGGE
jgi:hypothetical protein